MVEIWAFRSYHDGGHFQFLNFYTHMIPNRTFESGFFFLPLGHNKRSESISTVFLCTLTFSFFFSLTHHHHDAESEDDEEEADDDDELDEDDDDNLRMVMLTTSLAAVAKSATPLLSWHIT